MRVWAHCALTAIMAGLALALAAPGDMFANPTWAAFAKVGTESTWSFAFMAAAALGLTGLGNPRRWMLLLSTLALSTAHTTVAWMFYRSAISQNSLNTGIMTYATIAALGFVLALIRFTE